MARLSDSDRRTIEATIRDVERSTSAEFVAVVARRIDRHHATSLAAGLTAALIGGLAFAIFDPWAPIALALITQCFAFTLVYAVCELTPLAARLAPRRAREMKTRRMARLVFLDRGLGSLSARNGVLLLVALAERQVEIIADDGIDQLAGTAEWRRIVDRFAATARTGPIAAALETAIRDLGEVLTRHFPAAPGKSNQIPDRLIEL
ncbi:MAG: putative rane protein [Rhodospirillaceae bacterium]|nr:putative rane protein [Rhodospirillaceae bacterium]